MLCYLFNVWLSASFASKCNAWHQSETPWLRETVKPGASPPWHCIAVWGAPTHLGRTSFWEKIVLLLRMLSVRLWRPLYQAPIEYQLCLYGCNYAPWLISVITWNLCNTFISVNNCLHDTFHFSEQLTALPWRFCCMLWALRRILQNTGRKKSALLLPPPIQTDGLLVLGVE